MLEAYAAHLLTLAPVTGRRLKVVVDAGNGMAGYTAPAVFGRLGEHQVELVPMYFELDGTFPNHEANPIEPANLVDLQHRVVAEGADIGLAFDGDADRCFLVDERGRAVSPSTLTALIAARELAKEPGATVIHNLITSRAVPEIVTELGGTPVRTRVGHSYIKATMAETGAIFGGEHSGHFYFRDFWRADSGMLAALHALAALAETDRPLSRAARGVRALRRQRRDQLHRRRPGGAPRRPSRRRTPTGRRQHRPARRAERQPRRLVVQRAAVQHRAAAAPQRRRSRPRPPWPRSATPSSPSSGATDEPEPRPRPARDHRLPRSATPSLTADGEELVCDGVRARLPGARRHPGPAGRRGPQAGLTAMADLVRRVPARRRDRAGGGRRRAARPRGVRRAGPPGVRGRRRGGRGGRRRAARTTPGRGP